MLGALVALALAAPAIAPTYDDPSLAVTARPPAQWDVRAKLTLRRTPYLGVACPIANSIQCDRVGLAVWLRTPVARLRATIGARAFDLRPPRNPDGYWEGFLRPAGLKRAGSALHVTPDRGRYHWEGRDAPRVVVRLTAVPRGGGRARAAVVVDLRAGYG